MFPNSNARFFRLKAAQRDLIAAAGTIERAAEICNYGKSTVGRWNHAESKDLMPLDAVLALETECGLPLVTAAMAEVQGRRIADPEGEAAATTSIVRGYAEFCQRAGELMASMASALADGRITPAEAADYDRRLSDLQGTIIENRRGAAGVRGAGGYSVVEGGVK